MVKIGYIGGFKDGKTENYEYVRHKSISFDWIVEREDPSKRSEALMNRLSSAYHKSLNNDGALVYYNLMTLRKDGEAKLFYVIDGASRDDVKQGVADHWAKASTIGYDF